MSKRRMGQVLAMLTMLLVAASVIAVGPDLEIISISADDGELVFKTPANGTSSHHYRVESASSLVSSAWTMIRTVDGVGAAADVTNAVMTDADAMFYRIVSMSNSFAYVDGAYMAIDVSAGPDATEYPVYYYSTAGDVPGGVTNDWYKTTHLLMRRIPAGTFTMGSPEGELGRYSNEVQRQMSLTQDYYLGVFLITQKQWERVVGDWPSYFNNTAYRDARPVERVSYYGIRENPDNSAISPNWPQSSQVHVDSFMGKLREKTGLTSLDLPTEAQWERAARAGTSTALNSGKNITTVTNACPNMSEVGRYWHNGGSDYSQGGSTAVGSAKVGSYLPNAWGLYDMHGNVWEWCLDWYEAYHAPTTDPVGVDSGEYRVLRGGSWSLHARNCRSASRDGSHPGSRSGGWGFRLSRTLP